MEDASRVLRPGYLAPINGTASGGGDELALATEPHPPRRRWHPPPSRCPSSRSSAPCRAPAASPGWLTNAVSAATAPTGSAPRRGHARPPRGPRAGGSSTSWRPAAQARRRDVQRSRAGASPRRSSRPKAAQGHRAARRSSARIDGDALALLARSTVEIDRERRAATLTRRRAADGRRRPMPRRSMPQGAAFWPLRAGPRARRRDPASAPQRARDRHAGCCTSQGDADAGRGLRRAAGANEPATGSCARSCSTGSAP